MRINIKHLSPNRLDDVVIDIYSNISKKLNKLPKNKLKHKEYPFKLLQYSPKELMFYCEGNLLETKNIIYYHCHPFPPRRL